MTLFYSAGDVVLMASISNVNVVIDGTAGGGSGSGGGGSGGAGGGDGGSDGGNSGNDGIIRTIEGRYNE